MKYNFETLKNYALWYYFRYFPSNKKLQEKLFKKSQDENLSKKVFLEIKHLLSEEKNIQDKINLYLKKNKNLRYIKQKLLEKGFEKNQIEDILDKDFLVNEKSLLNEKSVRIKIENLKNKNKSITYIKNKLIERKEDKEIVENILKDLFENEEESIKNEIQKLKNKFDNKKIFQKLILKGFRYDDIKKQINF